MATLLIGNRSLDGDCTHPFIAGVREGRISSTVVPPPILRQVKDKYYHDTNTAGPQSRLLEGLTWDEARRVRDEGLVKALGPNAAALLTRGPVTDAPVGAASKAIIQRDLRDNAVIFEVVHPIVTRSGVICLPRFPCSRYYVIIFK